MFQTLKFIPPQILSIDGEILGILAFAVIGLLVMLVPFLDRKANTGDSSKMFAALGVVGLVYMLIMTLISYILPQTF
jgi:quinol-cytochrome oxidoreductase complex cytochrome b subunit